MNSVQLLIPERRTVEIDDVLARVTATPPLGTFSSEALELCRELSRQLAADPGTRQFPALLTLSFWLRPAALQRLRDDFLLSANSDRIIVVPRGTVFHMPPSNVETVFAYSWALSLLAGNRNVVRLPSEATPMMTALSDVLARVLSGARSHPGVNTIVIRYGHEREITEAISAAADLRVIWGGDAAISALRSVPLPPHARELTFFDRFSLSVVRTDAYLELDDLATDDLALRFYNDAYSFDQMACSSPRLVVWFGGAEHAALASERFFAALWAVIRRKRYRVETAVALAKTVFAHRAVLEAPVTHARQYGNELQVLELERLSDLRRDHCGAGLFFEVRIRDLSDLREWVVRQDQTLTHFGFTTGELRELAVGLRGRGIDRMVPFGQALTFNRFWDGYDMLHEFTRRIYVEPDGTELDLDRAGIRASEPVRLR